MEPNLPPRRGPRPAAFLSCLAFLLTLLFAFPGFGQQTVGLFEKTTSVSDGYVLFTTLAYPELFLVDNDGQVVHSWPTTYPTGNTAYLQDDGSVIRVVDPVTIEPTVFVAGGDAGMVQHLDWDGNVLWEYLYLDANVRSHHDIEVLPNGNVLMIAWEGKTTAEAIAAGRDPASMLPTALPLWPEHIVEVEPVGATGGNVVWEWHMWDHLIQDFDATKDNYGVVGDHPELIDVNYRSNLSPDWIHMNSVDYDAELDQIVLSAPRFHEFWIIDHSTTTAEAAGHTGGARGMGGDILYRWGNPEAYRAGTSADRQLFGQHDVSWIPPGLQGAGHILVFNNGNGRTPVQYSSIEELVTTADGNGDYPQPTGGAAHGPTAPFWHYEDPIPENLYSGGLGSAQRLPSGNVLAVEGNSGTLFEIDDVGNRHWLYVNPVGLSGPVVQGETPVQNRTFRATRYPASFAGFVGKDLTPKGTIEISPVPGLMSVTKVVLVVALSAWGLVSLRRVEVE